MKRIKFILVGIVLSFFILSGVQAKSETLDFLGKARNEVRDVRDMVSYKEGYILVSGEGKTILSSYDNDDKLVANKSIEGLKDSRILKHQENVIVVGVMANTLKVYKIDKGLKIIEQRETSYFVSGSTDINLYSYNDKVYVMLTRDGMLISSTIYEIDEDLHIVLKKFSSFGGQEVKDIFMSDYYLIHANDKEESAHYKRSTYMEGGSILVGDSYQFDEDGEKLEHSKGILTLLDVDGKKIYENISESYTEYRDVLVVDGKVLVLAKGVDGKNYLVIFDTTGKFLEEYLIDSDTDVIKIFKGANKIRIFYDDVMVKYGYSVLIYREEDVLGSVHVPNEVLPYDEVEVQVVPNSGYEVEKILVKDRLGREIKVVQNKFVMPDEDVYISVQYIPSVINPETVDAILMALLLLVILVPVCVFLYKKMIWLK